MKRRPEQYLVNLQIDDLTGEIERETWFDRNTRKVHRPNGPADIKFYEWQGRSCRSETYYQQGRIYRADDLPSRIVFDIDTGFQTICTWSTDGVITRTGDKPAVIKMDLETRIVTREEYWKDGVPHRDHGPAHIERHRVSGQIVRERFFVRGEEIVPQGKVEPDPL